MKVFKMNDYIYFNRIADIIAQKMSEALRFSYLAVYQGMFDHVLTKDHFAEYDPDAGIHLVFINKIEMANWISYIEEKNNISLGIDDLDEYTYDKIMDKLY